jgi:hypothetical protein
MVDIGVQLVGEASPVTGPVDRPEICDGNPEALADQDPRLGPRYGSARLPPFIGAGRDADLLRRLGLGQAKLSPAAAEAFGEICRWRVQMRLL